MLKSEIDVAQRGEIFVVSVRDGSGETEHDVRLSAQYLRKLGLQDADRGEIVAESILREFELRFS